ncbi:MAG: hypothetical protein HYY28_01310 [Betaproteobacteria bacterium]|nr:hypothetical protein [Betaproteobacteria bacterium]MBI2958924.1 hypothetical protein [Betaproteobacteria bacterium]
MGIAERIYEVVRGLPDAVAAEVLDYAEAKCAKASTDAVQAARRSAALALLEKHAGKFKAVKFNRAELYDRACLR